MQLLYIYTKNFDDWGKTSGRPRVLFATASKPVPGPTQLVTGSVYPQVNNALSFTSTHCFAFFFRRRLGSVTRPLHKQQNRKWTYRYAHASSGIWTHDTNDGALLSQKNPLHVSH